MMSNVNFYQVIYEGRDLWADGSAYEAVTQYRNAPHGSRLVVTLWDSEGDDAHLIGQQIDITDVVRHAIARGKL